MGEPTGKRRYDRSLLEAHPDFTVPEAAAALRAKSEAAGWPAGLLERVLGLRRDRAEVEAWIESGFPTVEEIEQWVPEEEAVLDSTLSVRIATWEDNDLITDLCVSSPETVGDWEVVVERGPNAFAQFRLQEHAYVVIAEDLRVGLGMVSRSMRNTIVNGQRTSTHVMSGWRVREGFRGLGLSKRLMQGAGPGTAWFGLLSYWYVRLNNQDRGWVEKVTGDMADRPGGWGATTERLSATITHFDQPGQGVRSGRVRPVTEADLEACCALINRTHDGLDLFRPYSVDYLGERLHDPSWGPKPEFHQPVYGWNEFLAVEVSGEIVACGGLWDRGRDVREHWRKPGTDEAFVLSSTALLDFGYAAGREDAMGELVSHFLAETASKGRTSLMAPLEFSPEVTAACQALGSSLEVRELHTMPFVSPTLTVDATVTRPYTDLAYW